ncbi:GrpB family protein [Arsenicicoccus sp. UBA6765]|uniref:GrpB family protein n=1 Tax=Arsenicicoccus sp. UBA6765 TaxID=1946056 RepID=UPI00257FFF51|nr:GrpB family protein [Arsenicicoccus sp. UBA6765]
MTSRRCWGRPAWPTADGDRADGRGRLRHRRKPRGGPVACAGRRSAVARTRHGLRGRGRRGGAVGAGRAGGAARGQRRHAQLGSRRDAGRAGRPALGRADRAARPPPGRAHGPSPAPARLVEHDQRWGVVAHRQLSRLARALGEAGVDRGGSGGLGGFGYEHIGSTAVPGLLAKAFVDLQVGVDEIPAAGGAFDEALLRCGYLPAVGSRPDSPGVDRDLEMLPAACAEEDYRKRLFYRPDPAAPVILYVRRAGTPWHDYPIRFRDLLRESTQHRERYAAVKTAAAQAHADDADHDDCTRAKGEVIRDVLVAAGCEPGRLERLAPLPVTRPETATPRRTRHTARVLPVDPSGRVLLLHGVDPDDRQHPLWFSLGGEIDPGEDPVTAALRELREEVGWSRRPATSSCWGSKRSSSPGGA